MTEIEIPEIQSQSPNSDRFLAIFPLFLMAGFGFYDFLADLRSGAPPIHLIVEIGVSLLGAGVGAILLFKHFSTKRKLAFVRAELAYAQTTIGEWTARAKMNESRIQEWKLKSERWVRGLALAIDQQFHSWQLSPAEKEVALLLIKGFSLKEIGHIRGTSEKTVRHQSQGVYGKSGLSGRAQLGAFFLEDLILPQSEATQFKFD